MKSYLIVLIIFLTIGKIALAQPPTYYLDDSKKIDQYNSKLWTTENGLPTNSLLNLYQTSDGYLWISSYQGLIRFDGNTFKIFSHTNTPVFANNTIRKISEDSNGTMWITTQGSGLVSYKNGNFLSFGKEVGITQLNRAIYIDNEDRIWSSSPEKGWFWFKNGKFTFLEYTSPLENIEVRTIKEGNNGSILFGTLGEGLFEYNDGKFKVYNSHNGLQNNLIYALFNDSKGKLWIGTSDGLVIYDGNKFIPIPELNHLTINDIIEDYYGNLWFATTNGIIRRKASTGEFEYAYAGEGLEHNFVNDILFDFEGNLWIANYKGGLAMLKDGKFTNYSQESGLKGKVVNAVCEVGKNSYLVAFDNGSLSLIENGKVKEYSPIDLKNTRIRHILKDDKQNLWFSTYSGLYRVSVDNKKTWFNQANGFVATQIRVTFQDKKGDIWIGTRNNGLIRLNKDNSFDYFNTTNGLSANLIMSIDEDLDGNILVGTSEGEGGLCIISGDKVIKTYKNSEGFISDVVFNTYVDSMGYIWVAANGGFALIKDTSLYTFTLKDGLIDDSPFDIIEDQLGYFWMPSSKGVMRMQRKQILEYALGKAQELQCRLYDKHDGMRESECNPTTNSLKASDGTIFFPTIDGVAKIDPQNIPLNNFYPPVKIEEFRIDQQLYNQFSNSIVIQPGMKRYTFNYTALSFYEPDKINFKYKLAGFDSDWILTNNIRTVSYTNLSPGEYEFKVMASNSDGIWNNQVASVGFSIKPRFVQTVFFYILSSILLIFLGYSLYLVRIVRLKNKHIELEHVIEDRTKEIRLKNDILQNQKEEILSQRNILEDQKQELKILNNSKDKMFSIIAHDLRSPLGNFRTILDIMINEPSHYGRNEREEMLLLLAENAKSTYEILENLLNWSVSQQGAIKVNPTIFKVSDLTNDLDSVMKPLADKKGISIKYNIPENAMAFADTEMIKVVLRNLISNAIKFTSENGEIIINAELNPDYIEIAVKDNGIGIQEKIKNNLFNQLEDTIKLGTNLERGSGLGLLLCKEFVEKNNGKIWLESKLGKGSTFFFTLKRAE